MFGFEELFGGGGFPGMGGGRGMPRKPKGDTTKLYKVLQVDQKASQAEIKKSYRKLARKFHPDRPTGDIEEFKKVQAAYDVLGNPNKRRAYDKTGDPNAEARPLPPGKPTRFQLEVPLKQFYKGHTRRIRVTKDVTCPLCNGEGGTGVRECTTCSGRGIRIVAREIGPGMYQRMQMRCNECGGKGSIIPQAQRCKRCNTSGKIKATNVLAVHIDKGMNHNEKITFAGEGDQDPDTRPGDVIVTLKGQRHPYFQRTPEGCHLIYNKKITLIEALTGFKFYIKHLDDRVLEVKSRPGMLYQGGDIEALRDEGMPLRNNPLTSGHLYVKFDVIYPKSLTTAQSQALAKLLGPIPPPQTPMVDDEEKVEEVMLTDVDVAAERRIYAKMVQEDPNAYESDSDDERGGGPGVACRQS